MAEIYVSPSDTLNNPGGPIALSVRQISKTFGTRGSITQALAGVSFDIAKGEYVAIMGPSGSGKTTLLNCISTIEKPTTGQIFVDANNITTLSKKSLSKFRRDELGFIFQDYNLLDTLTGRENISLALTIRHMPPNQITPLVQNMAAKLGVFHVLDKYPNQMSGGEKQRIAACRAIIGDPKLILADEPTGALDSHSAAVLLETLEMMNHEMSATILMVTHDAYAASFTNRVLFIKDGCIFNEIRRGAMLREEFFARIMEVVTFLGGEVGHVA